MRRLTLAVLLVVSALLTLGSAARQPASTGPIVLALDMSDSMADPAADGKTPKIEAAQRATTAMLRFFAQSNPVPRVAVVTFSDDPATLYPFTNNMDAIAAAIADLPAQVGGGTNLGAALAMAVGQLEGAGDGVIVLISDGVPTQGLAAAQIIEGPAQLAKQSGHCLYTLLTPGSGAAGDGAAFLEQLRDVAPCPYAGQILTIDDTPRLLWALSAAVNTSPGSEVVTASGALEPGESYSLEVRVPPDRGEIRVSAVSTGAAVALMLADPNGAQPQPAAYTEGSGLSAVTIANPEPGRWLLGLRNPSGAAVTYYVMIAMLPRSMSRTDVDTLISIAVAVGIILAVGLTVLAVERLRPRAAPPEAWLVETRTGGRLPLSREAITLDDPGVADCRAVVRYGRGRYYLQDRSGGRTLLNGKPVSAAPLVHGDRIMVGGVDFRFEQAVRAVRSTDAAG